MVEPVGLTARLPASVAQLLDVEGGVAGAGFLVAPNVLVTCAHAVTGPVLAVFPHLPGAPRIPGELVARRPSGAQDIAVIRLAEAPRGGQPLALGSATGCAGRRVRSFGFPRQAPPGGQFGYGVVGELLLDGLLLHLTDADGLTTGFSGGPVLDELTGLVIGMLAAVTDSDRPPHGRRCAYATPTEVLSEVWPDLAIREACPYLGLSPFTTGQAEWFHGREAATERVLAGLAQRAVLLLGPSGSGKSSLVQAGVLPALATGALPGSDRWQPVLVRPGQVLHTEPSDTGLLVIDQFEEVFTQPRTTALATLELLRATIEAPAAPRVLLVMRDDFYPQLAAQAPELLDLLGPGLVNVPAALSRRDLHAIITRPAGTVGLRFEDGLAERIITDVLAGAATTPVTSLPVLELTLSQLWERREDGCLTHRAYDGIGEVTGSLATWCDTALRRLPPAQHAVAQRLLTALVRPADDTRLIPAVRRQLPLADLRDLADPEAADAVLAALTRHRIVVTHHDELTGQPVAELIHDALIRDWPRLRGWVRQDHRFHDWLRRASDQRARWAERRNPDDLLHGTALAEGLDWHRQRPLPGDIAAFLMASQRHQQTTTCRRRRLNAILVATLVLVLEAVMLTTRHHPLW